MKEHKFDSAAPVKKGLKAAALKYNPLEDSAPIISAVGTGYVAQRILQKADENDIPIVADSSLADILTQLSVGDAIPPKLYEVVAQVLIFVSELDGNYLKDLPKF